MNFAEFLRTPYRTFPVTASAALFHTSEKRSFPVNFAEFLRTRYRTFPVAASAALFNTSEKEPY